MDLVEREVDVDGVKGVVVVFWRFDRRVLVGWALGSVSEGGGLESGRIEALRFLDLAGVLFDESETEAGSGSGD